MAYKMVSADGATYRTAATENRKDELEQFGYTVIEEPKPPKPARKKAVKADDGE